MNGYSRRQSRSPQSRVIVRRRPHSRSIGSIEPQFYAELLEKTGLAGEDLPRQMDRSQWPAMKERLAAIFRTKTREEAAKVGREIDAMAVSGVGMTGKRVPHQDRVREVIGVWSTLVPREAVRPTVTFRES